MPQITQTTATVKWYAATDNVMVEGYKVYSEDDQLLGAVTSTQIGTYWPNAKYKL
ncbi:MAG: hypothetical protein HC896_06860 [Bacteroidales bacterium]|nr:hypothetical protein [Bacteroidales bacterium]